MHFAELVQIRYHNVQSIPGEKTECVLSVSTVNCSGQQGDAYIETAK